MKSSIIRLLAVVALISPTYLARATTYFVASGGSDTNACTSAGSACRTIGHAANLAVRPGDVVQVAAGTYVESPTLRSSGSASGGAITFRGQDGTGCPTVAVSDVNHPTGRRPNSSVTLKGMWTIAASYVTVDCFHMSQVGTSSGADGFNVGMDISNITISNNEMQGSGTQGAGIIWTGITSQTSTHYASNMTISKNYIHDVSTGLFILCSSCTVSDNEITALTGDEPGSDHDYIDAWGVNTAFRHNYMHGNTCNSCNGYDCHMDCIQTFNITGDHTEVAQNITVDRNVCFNHHEGIIAQDNAGNGDVANWTVTNNVFAYGPSDDGSGHLCSAGPVHPWCWVFEDGNMGTNNKFANNTCIDGAEGFRSNAGRAIFQNNLYLSEGSQTSVYQTQGAAVTGSNNLYYATGGSFGSGTFPGDVVNKNPAVVSLGTGGSSRCIGCNFNIQGTSAAKDAGTATGVGVDLLGNNRPQGSAYDIGAYEFISALQPSAPTNLTGVVH